MKRKLELDVVRGVAIMLVLGRHLNPVPDNLLDLIKYPIKLWLAIGWIGVDLFFVLSGFLVSGLLFKQYLNKKRFDFGNFLYRRAWKIYPIFYLYILLVFFDWGHEYPMSTLVAELLFVQNYFGSYYAHSWSLAVEEHFYLVLCLVLFVIAKLRALNTIPLLVMVICVICLVWRISVWQDFSLQKNVFPTHLRLDSLFFGVLISYFFHFHNEIFTRNLKKYQLEIILVGCLCLTPLFFLYLGQSPFVWTWGFTLLYIGFGSLIAVFNNSSIAGFPGAKLLAQIGRYSYSIYLFHIPVKSVVSSFDLLETSYLLSSAVYISASIFFGFLIFIVVERPLLKLRDRLIPSSYEKA